MTCKLRRKLRPLPVWRAEDIDLETSRESSVAFGSIEVREYTRILAGDHTEIPNSLAIGWDFNQSRPVSVDDVTSSLEKEQVVKSKASSGRNLLQRISSSANPVRRSSSIQKASQSTLEPKTTKERREILKEFGYSKKELSDAETERIQKLCTLYPQFKGRFSFPKGGVSVGALQSLNGLFNSSATKNRHAR